MPTLSERISVLLDMASQLEIEIREVEIDVSMMDEIDSIEHLADVPAQIVHAKNCIGACVRELRLAGEYAILGGR